MVAKKSKKSQGPPLQFRPGVELAEAVTAFAGRHGLTPNDACKVLVALGVAEMDARLYPLVAEMAAVTGDANAFTRCCLTVQTALQTRDRLLAADRRDESERLRFVWATAEDYLRRKGRPLATPCPWAVTVPEAETAPPASKRQPAFEHARRRVTSFEPPVQPAKEDLEEDGWRRTR